MKKLLMLFVLAATLISCSNNDDNTNTEKVLQKVIFYKNSANEKHWNFSDGLLRNITLADGTIVEEFVYDNQNRVVSDIKYANGIDGESTSVTYNADNTIKSIDGLPYTYNAATRTYAYSYVSNFTINCKVNENGLALDFLREGVGAGEYHMTYSNGNMTSFEKVAGGSIEITKNFNFTGEYFGVNPIYSAVIAVARVKSLTDPSFFVDCQASKDIPNGFDKGASDPNHYNYGAVPDSNLYMVGVEVLDSSNNFVGYYSFADYYYR
ncbi:MAG: hypothetical protein QM710_06155 [Flavobacterium sp.]